ncbi:hypothetical protein M407DRAFT_245390 [Tulasnella calospora MUT 4182]|uniref:Arrestin-like N-terminal domain-containing protein n=1 Tax=Tulasnella calospora MUT 4182 TaxID=1051891 RepID=A0A0C3QBG5_9AGAM|nr:hypothetical protein M407DRAFT_245390 [Tulasnella calospora MUT 4182]
MVGTATLQSFPASSPAPPPYVPPYPCLPYESSIPSASQTLLSLLSQSTSANSSRAPSPPPFTPKSRPDELSLQFQPPPDTSSHYVYESRSITLNLGSRIEGASTPSFGNNATIDGTVYIKDWKHVKEVVLTITGAVHTTLLDNGTPIARQHPQVLNHVQCLWSSSNPSSSALNHSSVSARHPHPNSLPISYPLPTYAYASSSLLPPTRRAASSNLRLLVRYEIFVDLYRDGCLLHRHERVGGEWRYLPRSVPDPSGLIEGTSNDQPTASSPTKGEITSAPSPDPWKVFDLGAFDSTSCSRDLTVQFGLPRPLSYTSGIPIPYRVFIIPATPGSSVSALDIHSSLTVSLIKIISFSLRHHTSGRTTIEKVLGLGVPWKVEPKPDAEGIWQVDGYVNGIKAGGEMSWSLDGCVTVQYLLRVAYVHRGTKLLGNQLVQLVTDELGAIDVEAEEDAWERPQLGLLNGSCDPNAPENGGGSWMSRVVLF